MRDAHQSLLATRVRTEDIVKAAHCASDALKSAFSLECWGGATFDVTMRFLDECPWKRLREIRAACPNICLQMLLRGSNAVGYTSYPDNVVAEFVRLAALNGIDVFRIFDCFNDVDSMKVSIDSVVAAGKVAEVAVCYTGNLLTSDIYHVDYYKDVAMRAVEAGAHIIGIKDMAGLLRPNEAGILVKALRDVLPASMPIHFHTHSTSSGAIATCMEMARHGCDIIDVCTASMADGTSQPSMNAFVAMMDGCSNETGINYLDLEPYDMYWARVRLMYAPFESGMLSGSARVYEHQIPGENIMFIVLLLAN
jgi:pyruvate carboxylase